MTPYRIFITTMTSTQGLLPISKIDSSYEFKFPARPEGSPPIQLAADERPRSPQPIETSSNFQTTVLGIGSPFSLNLVQIYRFPPFPKRTVNGTPPLDDRKYRATMTNRGRTTRLSPVNTGSFLFFRPTFATTGKNSPRHVARMTSYRRLAFPSHLSLPRL